VEGGMTTPTSSHKNWTSKGGHVNVTVTPDGGEPVRFGTGDLVVFDAGLSCTWNVHAPVRKHYRFG
jgi:uncharacterized cupin superfamily protein